MTTPTPTIGIIDEKTLREIARHVEKAARSGYALFIFTGNALHYLSNAKRDDVIATLAEWDARGGYNRAYDDDAPDAHVALGLRCDQIGVELAQAGRIALFLFDFEERGSLAWFTNVTDMRTEIRTWLEHARGLS